MQYITKFFEFSDVKHFWEGRLKFGTLEEYRNLEGKSYLGARIDKDEGVHTHEINIDAPIAKDIDIPGFLKIENNLNLKLHGAKIITEVNEWVFCASIGRYSASLHGDILNGYGDYPGNANLHCYAVFDLAKLLMALRVALQDMPEFCVRDGSEFLLANSVAYVKASKMTNIYGPKYAGSAKLTDDEFLQLLFQKPKFFKPESEFRIVARLNAPFCLSEGESPIFPVSQAIKDSIVELGTPFGRIL